MRKEKELINLKIILIEALEIVRDILYAEQSKPKSKRRRVVGKQGK